MSWCLVLTITCSCCSWMCFDFKVLSFVPFRQLYWSISVGHQSHLKLYNEWSLFSGVSFEAIAIGTWSISAGQSGPFKAVQQKKLVQRCELWIHSNCDLVNFSGSINATQRFTRDNHNNGCYIPLGRLCSPGTGALAQLPRHVEYSF